MEVDEQRREAAPETRRRATRPPQESAMEIDGARLFPEFDAIYAWTPKVRVIVERTTTCIARERRIVVVEEEKLETYRVFRHIGGVYTIIGACCQETQARATSPNGCKPLQADKWPRLQR